MNGGRAGPSVVRHDDPRASSGPGPIGRLGGFAADHARAIAVAWAIAALVLAAFAPKVETALSGAGWQADGSESVQARTLIERSFAGRSSSALTVVVHSSSVTTSAPAFRAALARRGARARRRRARRLRAAAAPGRRVSRGRPHRRGDGRREGRPDGDGRRRRRARSRSSSARAAASVAVALTGSPAIWSEFNTANKSAMMKSELLSWPVTLVIIVLAFGSLVAAGLPLLLTILGLVSSAGLLALLTGAFDISIWAMNFALMFSLALGIDYALFIVHRFRASLRGSRLGVRDAVVVTMDTAGKAVLFSAMTVLVSLSAVLLVPSPAFRSTALGIMLSVAFVLAATLTLLPAVLAKLGPQDRRAAAGSRALAGGRLAAVGALGRAALAAGAPVRAGRGDRAGRARAAGPRAEDRHAVDQGHPARATAPGSATRSCSRRSAPARRERSRSPRRSARPRPRRRPPRRDPGIARVLGPEPGAGGLALIQAGAALRPVERGDGSDDRPPPRRPSAGRPRRRPRRREPRPRERAAPEDAARDRRRARARVPAAARRGPGPADRRAGRRSRTCSRPAPPSASGG